MTSRGRAHTTVRIPNATAYRIALIELLGNNQCVQCSTKQKLEIHHRDGDPNNNTANNLEVLCKKCHSRTTWPPTLRRTRPRSVKSAVVRIPSGLIPHIKAFLATRKAEDMKLDSICDVVSQASRELCAQHGYIEASFRH